MKPGLFDAVGMKKLPDELLEAWNKREDAAIFTTVSEDGTPNSVYVNWCGLVDEQRILIGDVEFSKTLENLKTGTHPVAFLFFSPGFAAYQIKGQARYASDGPIFESCQKFGSGDFTLKGAVEITPTEAFKGALQLS
jgi:predicted pyridoxine 5'-phosphate oxidase superfamily flavin-nucleotide-binding protein